MPEPTDMIIPMLQEMREENRAGLAAIRDDIAQVDRRLAKIERTQETFKQALAADTLMARLVTGEFEQRLSSLEKQVKRLQSQRTR